MSLDCRAATQLHEFTQNHSTPSDISHFTTIEHRTGAYLPFAALHLMIKPPVASCPSSKEAVCEPRIAPHFLEVQVHREHGANTPTRSHVTVSSTGYYHFRLPAARGTAVSSVPHASLQQQWTVTGIHERRPGKAEPGVGKSSAHQRTSPLSAETCGGGGGVILQRPSGSFFGV